MRSENISHMDLKPQNILITVNHPKISGHVLKLADFGFAQTFSSNEIKHAMRGSPLYMAPEMFLGRPYDAKVDLWSVGVILYECLFGKAPYKSESLEELVDKIKSEQPIGNSKFLSNFSIFVQFFESSTFVQFSIFCVIFHFFPHF